MKFKSLDRLADARKLTFMKDVQDSEFLILWYFVFIYVVALFNNIIVFWEVEGKIYIYIYCKVKMICF